MKLSDMTIDEAIAYAVREVPKCCPQGWGRIDQAAMMGEIVMRGWSKSDHANGSGWFSPDGDEYFRALWFHAAWVWLETNHEDEFKLSRCGIDDNEVVKWMAGFFDHKTMKSWRYEQWLPTEYHALAAACLLAAGKEVP